MESRPQNPEFRNNPENVHPCRINSFQQLHLTVLLSIKTQKCLFFLDKDLCANVCFFLNVGLWPKY